MGGKGESHCGSCDLKVGTVYYLECQQGRVLVLSVT